MVSSEAMSSRLPLFLATNDMDNKAVLYARVSSREQEDSGYSLPAQLDLLKSYCQTNNLVITKAFSVAESASGRSTRKTFDEMLRYTVEKNVGIIVCEKIDRLARNLKDIVAIDEWLEKSDERAVHAVKENITMTRSSKSHEKFLWGMKASMAKFYTDNLSEEVKKGQLEKLKQGWLPTIPPPGYKTVGEKGHKIHVLDNEKAPLIKKMFELYATGNYSVRRLTRTIEKEGLTNRTGTPYATSRIAVLLADPFYTGVNRWDNKRYEGKQEALVSNETFNRVQTILSGKTAPRYYKRIYLFKGLIRCNECGGTISWEEHKGHTYGHCNHYKACSQRKWVTEPVIDNQVANAIKPLRVKNTRLLNWIHEALKESHKDKIDYHKTTTSQLKQRLDKLQNRLDRLYDDKLDEKIEPSFYEHKYNQYSEEKNEILASLQSHSESSDKYQEAGIKLYELAQKAPSIYKSLDIERKQRLLRIVFQSIKLDKGIINYEYTPAFELLSKVVEVTESSKLNQLAETKPNIFEPVKTAINKARSGELGSEFQLLLRGQDSNLQPGGYTNP